MKISGAILLALAWFAPPCCLAEEQGVFSGNGDLYLSPAQVVALKQAALDGETAAASRLATYYALYRQDPEGAIKWYVIAAENGGVLEQCNAATVMKQSDDDDTRRRAGFWLKKCRTP